jgi:hypothetical protein
MESARSLEMVEKELMAPQYLADRTVGGLTDPPLAVPAGACQSCLIQAGQQPLAVAVGEGQKLRQQSVFHSSVQ